MIIWRAQIIQWDMTELGGIDRTEIIKYGQAHLLHVVCVSVLCYNI